MRNCWPGLERGPSITSTIPRGDFFIRSGRGTRNGLPCFAGATPGCSGEFPPGGGGWRRNDEKGYIMLGSELGYRPGAGWLEKIYVKIFGVPINGLRIRLRRVIPYLTGNPRRILDAGCGRGVFSYYLAKKYPTAEVTGIDIDEEQLEINRQIVNKIKLNNLKFVNCDICNIKYNEEFDLILSIDNLEHIENDEIALKNFNLSLTTGGKLLIHVPNFERRWFFVKFGSNFYVPGHFRVGYSMEEIIEKSKRNNFIIEYSCYTFGFLENLSNNISYLITKAEAKNASLYAVVFPFLLILSLVGSLFKPAKGAGIFVILRKK